MKNNIEAKQKSGVNLDLLQAESSAMSYTETKYHSYFQNFWKTYAANYISNIKKGKKDREQKQKSEPNNQNQLEKDDKVHQNIEKSQAIGKTRQSKESAPIQSSSKADNSSASEKKGAQAIQPYNLPVGDQLPQLAQDKEVNKNENKVGLNPSAFAKDKKGHPITNKTEPEVIELSNLKEIKVKTLSIQQKKIWSTEDQPQQLKQLIVVSKQEEAHEIQVQNLDPQQINQVQLTNKLIHATKELENESMKSSDIAFQHQKINQIQHDSEFSPANQHSKASSTQLICQNSITLSNIHSSEIASEIDKIDANKSYEYESRTKAIVQPTIEAQMQKQDSQIQVDGQIDEKSIPVELQSVEITKNQSQSKISVLQECQNQSDDFSHQYEILNKQVNEYATDFLSFLQKETIHLTEETIKIVTKTGQKHQIQQKKVGQNQGSAIQNYQEWTKLEDIPEPTQQNIKLLPELQKKENESVENPKDQHDVPNYTQAEDKVDEQSEKNSSDFEDSKAAPLKSEVEQVEESTIQAQLQNDTTEK